MAAPIDELLTIDRAALPFKEIWLEQGDIALDEYPSSWDLAWLASDRSDHLAAFITAGSGPIPRSLLPQLNRHNRDENLEYLMLQLPKVSEVHLLVTAPTPDSYVELAKRGLYVFDWTDIHRATVDERNAYEIVATPSLPTNSSFLTGKLANIASQQKLAAVRFGEQQFLDVSSYLDCSFPQ